MIWTIWNGRQESIKNLKRIPTQCFLFFLSEKWYRRHFNRSASRIRERDYECRSAGDAFPDKSQLRGLEIEQNNRFEIVWTICKWTLNSIKQPGPWIQPNRIGCHSGRLAARQFMLITRPSRPMFLISCIILNFHSFGGVLGESQREKESQRISK